MIEKYKLDLVIKSKEIVKEHMQLVGNNIILDIKAIIDEPEYNGVKSSPDFMHFIDKIQAAINASIIESFENMENTLNDNESLSALNK